MDEHRLVKQNMTTQTSLCNAERKLRNRKLIKRLLNYQEMTEICFSRNSLLLVRFPSPVFFFYISRKFEKQFFNKTLPVDERQEGRNLFLWFSRSSTCFFSYSFIVSKINHIIYQHTRKNYFLLLSFFFPLCLVTTEISFLYCSLIILRPLQILSKR